MGVGVVQELGGGYMQSATDPVDRTQGCVVRGVEQAVECAEGETQLLSVGAIGQLALRLADLALQSFG